MQHSVTRGFIHDRAMSLHRRAWKFMDAGRPQTEFARAFPDVDAVTIWCTAALARETGRETGRPAAFFFPLTSELGQ